MECTPKTTRSQGHAARADPALLREHAEITHRPVRRGAGRPAATRPYDLRHAGISFWLHLTWTPAESARRAGQSIEVLFRHYAKFPRAVPDLIGLVRNCWSGVGDRWDELG